MIQTIGRAARNIHGKVILYADNETDSIKNALIETERRRRKQIKWNKENNITPKSIEKGISNAIEIEKNNDEKKINIYKNDFNKDNINKYIIDLKKEMFAAATELKFEEAAELRDKISELEKIELEINNI